MSTDAQPLPMAPSGCALDDRQLVDQLARYRQLSASVLGIVRDGCVARIRFGEQIDTELLGQTLAIERGCCGFFTLEYDASARTLVVATDPAHADGLSVLLTALTPRSAAATRHGTA